jgi:hypothetical protein
MTTVSRTPQLFRQVFHLAQRPLLLAICSVGLALAGCSKVSQPSIENADWANIITDLDCSPINQGVEVDGARFADVRGQGVKDAFVWVDCQHPTSGWPMQLEVFDGSSDPVSPRRIAVLINANEEVSIIDSISFSGDSVTVHGASLAPNDHLCCPSIRLRWVFVWNGARFQRASG